MTPLRFIQVGLSLAVSLLSLGSANADFVLGLSLDGQSTPTETVRVQIGQPIPVELILRQTGAETRLGTDGLFSFATRLRHNSDVISVSAITGNADLFGETFTRTMRESANSFIIAGDRLAFAGGAKGDAVKLGSFIVTLNRPGTAALQLEDFDPFLEDFALDNLDFSFSMDDAIFEGNPIGGPDSLPQVTLQVTSVPEPGSALFLALGIVASIRRIRHSQKPPPVTYEGASTN
ncbi:hypothetical protein [Crateriforma conspicua]|uniref:PEP-CTERM protein-sorting domain-containing protein n=1 Tax=Crateriforma conspicua TaxID=2527996 RepID=A0A5C6FZ32_9PLAN|nr:hypothetical protein [Crateriforma conspicua]TWU66885.1 hypothetical protein V7x_24560 [Crateriforma conspicua]